MRVFKKRICKGCDNEIKDCICNQPSTMEKILKEANENNKSVKAKYNSGYKGIAQKIKTDENIKDYFFGYYKKGQVIVYHRINVEIEEDGYYLIYYTKK